MVAKRRPHTIRIIAGEYKSRLIQVEEAEDLRPTSSRMRETLFNWLAPLLPDSICLDLFSGSGALGLEAISRGARQVTFIEKNPRVFSTLLTNIKSLNIPEERYQAYCQDAFLYLKKMTMSEPLRLLFLDPPFSFNYPQLKEAILENPYTRQANYISLESPRQRGGKRSKNKNKDDNNESNILLPYFSCYKESQSHESTLRLYQKNPLLAS